MSQELVGNESLPAIASNSLIDIAEQAERRVEAIIKIKKVALKVTNKFDWVNQQDRPYLQVSGSEKIANLFNMSWRIDEPRLEFEDDGHFTYTFKGEFSLAGRSIEVEGSRSSKDPFFKKYDWLKDENGKSIKTGKPISAIDKRDVKMAALTNLLGNGISRMLGIRNLQWSDLLEFAGIKKEDVAGVEYKSKGERPPIQEPQKKQNGAPTTPTDGFDKTRISIKSVDEQVKTKDGKAMKSPLYHIISDNMADYRTFDKTLAVLASKEVGTGMFFDVTYKKTEYGLDLKSIIQVEIGPAPE